MLFYFFLKKSREKAFIFRHIFKFTSRFINNCLRMNISSYISVHIFLLHVFLSQTHNGPNPHLNWSFVVLFLCSHRFLGLLELMILSSTEMEFTVPRAKNYILCSRQGMLLCQLLYPNFQDMESRVICVKFDRQEKENGKWSHYSLASHNLDHMI